jgi:hypothetical protein
VAYALVLSEEEMLFLEILASHEGYHTTDKNLRDKLAIYGIKNKKYSDLKRKLIFEGYIGTVYGNVILEKKHRP